MPQKKTYSQLFKYFNDDYLLNHRTIEKEKAIIKKCIDANIPIPTNRKAVVLSKKLVEIEPKSIDDEPKQVKPKKKKNRLDSANKCI